MKLFSHTASLVLISALLVCITGCGRGTLTPIKGFKPIGQSDTWNLTVINDSQIYPAGTPCCSPGYPIIATIATTCIDINPPYTVLLQPGGNKFVFAITGINFSDNCFFLGSYGTITITDTTGKQIDQVSFSYRNEVLNSRPDIILIDCGLYGESPTYQAETSWSYDLRNDQGIQWGPGVCAAS